MTTKSNTTRQGGRHGQEDLDGRTLRDEAPSPPRHSSDREQGGREAVSDEPSGRWGYYERRGLEVSEEDDAIDRITRRRQ